MKQLFIFSLILVLIVGCKEDPNKSALVDTSNVQSGDQIINQISSALKEQPNNSLIYNDRAKRYIEMDAYDEAIVDLKASIQIDSLNPTTYHLLADAYMDYYQSRKALRTMRDLLDIYPDRIPSLLKLAEFQVILKKYDNALITINKIAKIDPQNGDGAFMLGIVMQETGDIKSATNAFKKATEFDSQITDAWLMLGQIYEAENNPIAETYYRNALKTNSNSVNAMHSLAYYLQNHNKINDAIDLYNKIILTDKNYEPAYLNTGILYLEQKNYKEAVNNFKILSSINPKSHLAYYFMGVSYEALGDKRSAIDNYQNAINFKPDYKEAQDALDKINK